MLSASSSESRAGGPDSRKQVTLQGGPKDGTGIAVLEGAARIQFPATWVNDGGDDSVRGLAIWEYDAYDGRFLGEHIQTETWGADGFARLIAWLWRDA